MRARENVRSHRRPPERLGVYSDGPSRLVESEEGTRLAPVATDIPFLTFVCAVGRAFESLTLFARARRADGEVVGHLLPASVNIVALPFYESMVDARGVLRATPGSVLEFWSGLAQVDAVWILGPHPYALFFVPLALLRRKTVVLGVRQDTMTYYRARLRGGRGRPSLLLARSWDLGFRALARVLKVTVVGDDLVRQYGGQRPRLLKMTVSLLPEADVVRAPTPRDWSGTINLLTVGRIDAEKNPMLLVEAFARLEEEHPGRFRLVWAGTGLLADDVAHRAEELGVRDRIELLGHVPFGPELLERYRSAHLFVHVSLTEGLPATIVEALGSATPVVATAVGGIPSALGGGEAGVLVPPSDLDALVAAILRLTGDAELRERVVGRGLELAAQQTLESTSGRVARFIRGEEVDPPT
jgi:glycosyltransferase involved in cell wall biosynthesis